MDIIKIEQLKCSTIIGVNPWERVCKQKLLIDIAIGTDILAAAKSDDIKHTLDYDFLANNLQEFINGQQCQLLETLVECTAEYLLTTFKLSWLRLTISKPGALPNAKNVSITIERGQFPGH